MSWGEITVRLELQTRKFFCDNDGCWQRIFCERLPEVVAPYGRQTIRFNQSLTTIGTGSNQQNPSQYTQLQSALKCKNKHNANAESQPAFSRAYKISFLTL
jgi:hypothetical protein